jgi:predicted permease
VLTGSTTTGRTLLVAQIALSLVLLVIASLFAQSIMRLHANAPGSRPSQLVWARLWTLPGDRTPTFGAPYWTALAQRFAEIRDVQSVAYSFNFPATLGATPAEERFSIADSGAGEVAGSSDAISPGFFQTTGIGLLQGRDVSWADTIQTPMVGIVSQSLARILFRDEPAVGRQVRLRRDPSRPIEIIGVAADAAVGNMHDPRPLVLYRPLLQEPSRARIPNALLRSRGDVDAVREAYPRMASAGGHHFTRNVYRLDESANQAVLRERLVAWFASFFATLAVVLSCIGVYGLLAYSVARRTREIGVRMALGAAPGVLVTAIAREGTLLGLAGVALGIPVALGAGRFAASLLYGLTPNDPLTIATASVGFVALATLAGLIPAYRASQIDPTVALRDE